MLIFDKFKEHAKRILSIPSHAESGNEELARYLQSLMHDYGFKTQLQQVNHSVDRLSKRQANLIGFSSDNLVDRSSRRGVLFINPLDVTTGNLPQLWTATQGNPHAPVVTDQGIVGAGAVQGKLDFLCRIFAAIDLLDKRHKSPIYLVGTCASQFGMMGSRFLIESLSVNPKEVFSFAPTNFNQCKQSPGQVSFTIDLESSNKERDSRGYNRVVDITAYGLSVDFATPNNAINSFDLLTDLVLEAAEQGFDFQWSALETKSASGTNPDFSRAQIFLTAFQFEDFKQFVRNRVGAEDQQRFFRVDYGGISEGGTSFIPGDLIEVVLELDYEWKAFIVQLNSRANENFDFKGSVGALTRIEAKTTGKLAVTFELRFLPNHSAIEVEEKWKAIVRRISEKHAQFHFNVLRDYIVQGVMSDQALTSKNTNYLSDAGWFHKGKFPVTIIGAGSTSDLPKGPNEAILWSELEKGIQVYRDLMSVVSQQ
ncbi:MAG: M20/M25/M40 family metallo-hydrolase [Bdellovibrionales bacterium]|nr:M20/M25/M40 family metallo-hydrolase [Oligoflexia bacterium]